MAKGRKRIIITRPMIIDTLAALKAADFDYQSAKSDLETAPENIRPYVSIAVREAKERSNKLRKFLAARFVQLIRENGNPEGIEKGMMALMDAYDVK